MSSNIILCLNFILCLSAHLVVIDSSVVQDVTARIRPLIFGKLWAFDEYCGVSNRKQALLISDAEVELFHNGTLFEMFHELDEPAKIDKLVRISSIERSSTSLICAYHSWGYSDEKSRELSQNPQESREECRLRVAGLHKVAKKHGKISSNRTEVNQVSLRQFMQVSTLGRLGTGQVFDNQLLAGDYWSCMKMNATRYCYGTYGKIYWSQASAFRVGLCLPDSCASDHFKASKELLSELEDLVRYNMPKVFELADGDKYALTDVYCPPAKDSTFREPLKDVSSKLLALVGLLWALMLAYCSWIGASSYWLQRFDLRKNWSTFADSRHLAPELIGLNSIKVFGFLWLMSCHYFIAFSSYLSNRREWRDQMNESYLAAFLLSGNQAVPAFFIMSGLLVGRKELGRWKQERWLRFVVERYARFLPLYLVVYAYHKKFFHLSGSGPLWDYGVSPESESRQCLEESWLVPLLMLANFLPPFPQCILTGWHIANDVQIYLLLPILFQLYQRSPKRGNLLALACLVSSHLYNVWNFATSEVYSFQRIGNEPHVFGPRYLMDRMAYAYVNPVGRLGSYCLGLLLADRLARAAHEEAGGRRWKSRLALVAGFLWLWQAVFAMLAPKWYKNLLGAYGKALALPITRLQAELGWFFLLLGLLLNSLANSASVEPESSRSQGLAWRCARWPIWNVLAKLNYALLLSHYSLARHLVQSQPDLVRFSWPLLLQQTGFFLLASYLLALAVHLGVEMPLMALVGRLLAATTSSHKDGSYKKEQSAIKLKLTQTINIKDGQPV